MHKLRSFCLFFSSSLMCWLYLETCSSLSSSSWILNFIPPCTFFLETSLLQISVSQIALFLKYCSTSLQKGKLSLFWGCVMQVILTLQIGCTECTLLAVMPCDRHVAMCKSLHYSAIMTQQLCLQLALGSWTSGLLVSLIEYCCFPSSLWRSEHSQTLILWTSCFFKGGFRR